jgi:hypothetical protein
VIRSGRNRARVASTTSNCGSCRCRLIFFRLAAHDNFQRIIRQGLCSTFASSHGARIQTSRSSSVVKITGIAFEWIGSTMAFGAVVRKPYTR